MQENPQHLLSLENRSMLRLTAVTDIDRFDEKEILLYTGQGQLTIGGKDLHIRSVSLETGEMLVEGDIWLLQYGDRDKCSTLSLAGRLLR